MNLVKKAKKGDAKAFLTLFQSYEQDIYRIAFIYVKKQNDALDVVQETAYRSFKTIKSLKKPKYFKTWLIKIAINCSLDLVRHHNKVVQLNTTLRSKLLNSEKIEDIDLRVTVQDLIEQLNEDEKSVVILKFYEDLTFKEIAEILEIPLGTAKTFLYRALNKLKYHLKEDDPYE